MIINKDIIAQRKAQYGNNFPLIAELWSAYIRDHTNVYEGGEITPQDAAVMMGLMKISRLANSPSHSDSLTDLLNYIYIGTNYEDYEQFQSEKKIDW
jgi:hypothetical protein